MPSHRTAAAFTAAALSLTALAACSSSAGAPNTAPTRSATSTATAAATAGAQNAGLTDSALLAAFKKAADNATAVHLKGTMKDGPDTIALDLQLNRTPNTAQGTIVAQGATIPIISVGGVDYFQFTDSVIKMAGADAVAPLIKDKWVSSGTQIGKGMDSGLRSLVSYDEFIGGITSAGSGDLAGSSAAGTRTYDGQTVAAYTDENGTEAYFAANGPAYLLAILDSSSSDGGVLTFDWNKPTTVTAPPDSQIYKG